MRKRLPSPLFGKPAEILKQIARAKVISAHRPVPVSINPEAEAEWIINELAINPEAIFALRAEQREFEYQNY